MEQVHGLELFLLLLCHVLNYIIIGLYFYSNLFIIVGYIPRFVLAGSLIYITIDFFKESLWDAFFQYTFLDYIVIVVILLCSALSDISFFK